MIAAALSLTTTAGAATGGAHAPGRAAASSFSFALKPSSAAISACLPKAGGHVTITPGALNDTMTVNLRGQSVAQPGPDMASIQPLFPFQPQAAASSVSSTQRSRRSP